MTTAADTRAAAPTGAASPPFDVARIRDDFPILKQVIHGRPLAYLDNAATAQKPRVVLDAEARFYREQNANIHRGVHALSIRATEAYEHARDIVQRFLGAARREEIIFVRGATEGINLVAQTFGRVHLHRSDEILVSELEHHSNIVPWQLLCEQTGAVLRVVRLDERGDLRMDEFEALLTDRTKLVAMAHVSNALGTINPVKRIVERAHARGVHVLLDGAQAVPHLAVNVRELDCDFYVFSGHKVFGPTGVGVLYGKNELLETLPPYQGGGEMIKSVTFEQTLYNDLPHRFEAGTPNIAGVIGLGAALEYVSGVGFEAIGEYEHQLLEHATQAMSAIPQVRLIGTARRKAAVLSFVVDGVHAHDVGTVLDQYGVAVRTGQHCAQPALAAFGVEASARASLALYNTVEEIDRLAAATREVVRVFRL